MATAGTVLNMIFKDAGEKKHTISLNHADDEAASSDINALMGTIITNKSVFDDEPVSKVGAQVVTTSVRDIVMTA